MASIAATGAEFGARPVAPIALSLVGWVGWKLNTNMPFYTHRNQDGPWNACGSRLPRSARWRTASNWASKDRNKRPGAYLACSILTNSKAQFLQIAASPGQSYALAIRSRFLLEHLDDGGRAVHDAIPRRVTVK